MVAPLELPTTEDCETVDKIDFRSKPFDYLLRDCLPFLSVQDLGLIADDLIEYVLAPDSCSKQTTLFVRYPRARLVFTCLRLSFRAKAWMYKTQGLFSEDKPLSSQDHCLYVYDIIHDLSYLLHQRLNCYAAGLNIDLITALSATAYESKSPKGETIAILPSLKWLETDALTIFEHSGRLSLVHGNVRALRKQLNICGSGALAICKDDVTGVYETVGLISQDAALKFARFRFQQHAEWTFAVSDLKHGCDDRLRYCNGSLMLPILDFRDVYQEKLKKLPITVADQVRLVSIIDGVNDCKHGAILIIADEKIIHKEAERLTSNKRGTRLSSPIPLFHDTTPSPLLTQFAAVDGAILLDFQGRCHAFGVILDGIVNHAGSNARGSRYNSTKAYTEWARDTAYPNTTILGIVKSEDGMLDLFDKTKGVEGGENTPHITKFLKKIQKNTIDFFGNLW